MFKMSLQQVLPFFWSASPRACYLWCPWLVFMIRSPILLESVMLSRPLRLPFWHTTYGCINFKRQYKVLINQNLRTTSWAALLFLSRLDFCFFTIDFFNFFIRDYKAALSINLSTEFRFLSLILNSKRLLPSWVLRSTVFAAFSISLPAATSIQHSPS
jgi:hypothetical protein